MRYLFRMPTLGCWRSRTLFRARDSCWFWIASGTCGPTSKTKNHKATALLKPEVCLGIRNQEDRGLKRQKGQGRSPAPFGLVFTGSYLRVMLMTLDVWPSTVTTIFTTPLRPAGIWTLI